MAFIKVPIEVDITYVNKTWFSLKKKYKADVRHYVIGIYQRGIGDVPGVAIINTLSDNSFEVIEAAVLESIGTGAILYCEKNILPITLKESYEIVELQDGKHSNGDVHVNNVKNMWKDLKRTIKQTHVQVSQKHLHLYCGEVAWRANHRHLSPSDKFHLILNQAAMVGKRPYKNLIK